MARDIRAIGPAPHHLVKPVGNPMSGGKLTLEGGSVPIGISLSLDSATLVALKAMLVQALAGLATHPNPQQAQLDRMEAKLDGLNGKVEQILMDEAIVAAALTKIDAATTNIAKNVTAIATLDQQVSNELDAFIAAAKTQGVSQALIDQVTATAAKAQAASDAGDALIPPLQAIAAKGVQNPVPVPVPAPVAA
jgi:hypothetical protein